MLSQLLALAWAPLVLSSFPPEPKGVKTIKSKYHEGVTISYKKVNPELRDRSVIVLISLAAGALRDDSRSQELQWLCPPSAWASLRHKWGRARLSNQHVRNTIVLQIVVVTNHRLQILLVLRSKKGSPQCSIVNLA